MTCLNLVVCNHLYCNGSLSLKNNLALRKFCYPSMFKISLPHMLNTWLQCIPISSCVNSFVSRVFVRSPNNGYLSAFKYSTYALPQNPVRVTFAMSINKSQGKILYVAGLHLLESCFSHGQLHIGRSRVRTKIIY